MTTPSRTSKWRAILKLTALLFILVVLPIGSWFYLQSGKEFREQKMEELGEIGQLLDDTVIVHDQGTADSVTTLLGKITVLTTSASEQSIRTYHRNLLEQFNDRDDFGFLIALEPEDETWYVQSDSMNAEDALYWTLPGGSIESTFWLRLDTTFAGIPKYSAVLIDTEGTVRKMYDLNEERDRTRLIEHIALILPREEKRRSE